MGDMILIESGERVRARETISILFFSKFRLEMARNQIILDSDDEDNAITRETSQSGVMTPSSVATSSSHQSVFAFSTLN